MNVLLDTHSWLWFHLGDQRLSQTARQHIIDPANSKFVSPASFWEISIKISLGKYILRVPYGQFMRDAIFGHGFSVLDINTKHTELVASLPFHHRDPFDRLLIAQAQAEEMSIISADEAFCAYRPQVIW